MLNTTGMATAEKLKLFPSKQIHLFVSSASSKVHLEKLRRESGQLQRAAEETGNSTTGGPLTSAKIFSVKMPVTFRNC